MIRLDPKLARDLDRWITREPNYEEPQPVAKCACCKEEMFEEDECYQIGDDSELYCTKCVKKTTVPTQMDQHGYYGE